LLTGNSVICFLLHHCFIIGERRDRRKRSAYRKRRQREHRLDTVPEISYSESMK